MDFTVNVCESSDSVALLCCITFVVDGSECSAKLCSSFSALLVNLLFAFSRFPLSCLVRIRGLSTHPLRACGAD